jgi:SAM-dependent methyltransferase
MRETMLYDETLAGIHDVAFGDISRRAAPVLLGALARAGFRKGLVVDLGCGSGIFAQAIAARGYEVLGVDVSAAMLRLARRRAPHARFRLASLHEIEIPPAVAVTGIGESFNYFEGRVPSERRLTRLFRRIDRALAPGGVLLFDLAAPGRVRGPSPAQSHFEGPDWSILVTNEESRRRKVLTRRIVTFRKTGRRYRRSEEIHRQRLFEPEVVLHFLKNAGFLARALSRYGDLRFPSGLVGYLAVKRRATRRSTAPFLSSRG